MLGSARTKANLQTSNGSTAMTAINKIHFVAPKGQNEVFGGNHLGIKNFSSVQTVDLGSRPFGTGFASRASLDLPFVATNNIAASGAAAAFRAPVNFVKSPPNYVANVSVSSSGAASISSTPFTSSASLINGLSKLRQAVHVFNAGAAAARFSPAAISPATWVASGAGLATTFLLDSAIKHLSPQGRSGDAVANNGLHLFERSGPRPQETMIPPLFPEADGNRWGLEGFSATGAFAITTRPEGFRGIDPSAVSWGLQPPGKAGLNPDALAQTNNSGGFSVHRPEASASFHFSSSRSPFDPVRIKEGRALIDLEAIDQYILPDQKTVGQLVRHGQIGAQSPITEGVPAIRIISRTGKGYDQIPLDADFRPYITLGNLAQNGPAGFGSGPLEQRAKNISSAAADESAALKRLSETQIYTGLQYTQGYNTLLGAQPMTLGQALDRLANDKQQYTSDASTAEVVVKFVSGGEISNTLMAALLNQPRYRHMVENPQSKGHALINKARQLLEAGRL